MQVWYFRDNACAISDPENQRVIITGGGGPQVMISNNVTVYGHQGWIEDLPNLQYSRTEHGCTSYLSKGKRVSVLYSKDENLKIDKPCPQSPTQGTGDVTKMQRATHPIIRTFKILDSLVSASETRQLLSMFLDLWGPERLLCDPKIGCKLL